MSTDIEIVPLPSIVGGFRSHLREELGYVLLLNTNSISYMGSPTAPFDLILKDQVKITHT